MNTNILLKTAAATLLAIALSAEKTFAGTIHKGWNYTIDSFSDGVSGAIIGPTGPFEFYGMAMKEDADNIFLALNANLPITGDPNAFATNGSIAWGDLFFNFSGQDFKTASANGDLFAVRFSEVNDSGVPELSVYSNVTAKNVTQTNVGFMNIEQYNNTVVNGGGTPSMGDLAINDPYLEYTGAWNILNSINSGTKIGDINFLDSSSLTALELDFAHFNAVGSHTIAFSFARDLLPADSFIAHIWAECANDGMALQGELAAQQEEEQQEDSQNVPEPSQILGLILIGLLFGRRKYKQ